MEARDFWNWVFELGQLRRIDREGWKFLGIKNPESVAEHSLRAAQIAFVLAKLEGYPNPFEVCTLAVFHELEECRVGDMHRVAKKYIKSVEDEKVVEEQVKKLGKIGREIFELWEKVRNQDTKAGIIAKDADFLEAAATAKELMDKGFEDARDWIENVRKELKTKSARRLLEELESSDSNEWWITLKKSLRNPRL